MFQEYKIVFKVFKMQKNLEKYKKNLYLSDNIVKMKKDKQLKVMIKNL